MICFFRVVKKEKCQEKGAKQGEAFRGDQAKDRARKEEFRFAIDAIAISREWCVVAINVRKQGHLKIQF